MRTGEGLKKKGCRPNKRRDVNDMEVGSGEGDGDAVTSLQVCCHAA